jgi:hypothetical protein
MKNRRFLFLGLTIILLINSGCKKTVENAGEDFMTNLITNNLWLVDGFSVGTTIYTADFSSFEYKFNKDGSVYGRKTGASDEIGTWRPDANAQTISSNFPNSPHPCNKLNGLWQIQKTTLNSVQANRFDAGVEYKLSLVKK